MRHFQTITGLAALVGVATPAAAAPTACMTDPEVSALVAYMAPPVLRSAAKICAPSLGPNSYLATGGTALAAQYQLHANRNWPQARSAMLKLIGEEESDASKLLANLSDQALSELVNAGFVQAISGDLKVADCPKIDRLVRSLAPLPVEPVTQLVAGLMSFGKDPTFPLCEAG